MKTLILTEKPSFAKNIGDALGHMKENDGFLENEAYVITWAQGHLYDLKNMSDYGRGKKSWHMDYFPYVPKIFEYKIKIDAGKDRSIDSKVSKQVKVITELFKREDINTIISACGHDCEGQIMGDIIFKMLKPKQKILRLLLNEWTQSAVLKGLNELKSNQQLINLRDSGISRQWADWVIETNLIPVSTLKYAEASHRVFNVGRVLTPTLKMIYDRDLEIERFKSETYFKLKGLFIKNSDAFEATYFEDKKDSFPKEDVLKDVLETLSHPSSKQEGLVLKKDVKTVKISPPVLFNLTALQGFISSNHSGWSSKKVMDVAQTLYEKKLITYPSTSSIALNESFIESARKVLIVHTENTAYESLAEFKVTKRIFDQKKVLTHGAIMPTYLLPKDLSEDETTVYYAIRNRFLKQFLPLAIYEKTDLVLDVKGYLFKASSKVCLDKGWQILESKKQIEPWMPNLSLGEVLSVRALNIRRFETEPQAPYNEKTLLHAMETCGNHKSIEEDIDTLDAVLSGFSIGTPHTRGDIIEKLLSLGYIEGKDQVLKTTTIGRNLIEIFPVKALFDLNYIGGLEKQLEDIKKGNLSRQSFLKSIFNFTAKSVEIIKTSQKTFDIKPKLDLKVLGKCPACGGQVIEKTKSYSCNQWQTGCKFVIWKEDKFFLRLKKKPSKTMVKELLKHKKAKVTGFTSKSGRQFDAYVYYEKKEGSDYYQWRLEF